MINRQLTLSLAVALAIASPCASALGLGQLKVRSGLDQPLVAEIPIISATPSELDQLDVRLASPDAFSRVGLDLSADLTANLHFSIGKNSSGQPVIKVTTAEKFSEPFLSFLIEADWGKGAVTREYTALIDPPYIAPAVIQPMLTPVIAAAPAQTVPPAAAPVTAPVAQTQIPAPAQALPAREPEPVAVEPAPAPTPAPAPAPQPIAAAPAAPAQPTARPAPVPQAVQTPQQGQIGPVSSGQTLWSIANSVRPDSSVSMNQMMVALLRANPEAFAEDNINRLKRGSVLRVPGQDEINRLSPAEAALLVSQQAIAWRSPREAIPQPAETGAGRSIAPAPAAAKPSAPAVASANTSKSGSRLEIVPPSGNAKAAGAQSGAASGAGGSELRAELVQAKEDLAARSAEVTELKSRVSELVQQDSDRRRLIEMQNSQLKELQDRLQQLEAEQAASAVAGAAPTAVAGPVPAPATTAGSDANAAVDASAPAVNNKPWYLDPLAMGAAVLFILGGLVLAMRRTKAKPRTDGPAAPRASDDEALRASMARTRESGERIKQEPVLEPVKAVPETKSDAKADPELDALVAQVAARPRDLEAHLNLLRLHHARGNAVDYEVAAQSMRLQLASTMDPRWREAVIMGASLMPGHTLFSHAGWNSPRYSEPDAPPAARATTPPATPPTAQDEAAVEPVAEQVKVFEHPFEPDLTSVAAMPLSESSESSSNEIDLDDHRGTMFGGLATKPVDIHRNEAELMVEDEASATRIDLARAYLDFGDLEGARSMLEEVLAEGGPSAKAEAARLLKEIG